MPFNSSAERCYACNRLMRLVSDNDSRMTVVTEDGQMQYVGPDCFAKIIAADTRGYQPPLGGPRLFVPNKGPAIG